jgi:uncharacterized DUF497 family protein
MNTCWMVLFIWNKNKHWMSLVKKNFEFLKLITSLNKQNNLEPDVRQNNERNQL